jgi:glycine C-acetyltransferase
MKKEYEIPGKNEKISFELTSKGAIDATLYTLFEVMINQNLDNLTIKDRLSIFNSWLEDLDARGLSYHRRIGKSACNTSREMFNPATGKTTTMVNFASNDYLNLSQHPAVINSAILALQKFGAGPGSPSNSSGHNQVKEDLENEIAETFNNESAMVFTSGFATNVGVLKAILRSNDVAIVDILAHASIMDGVEGKNTLLFKHNDMKSLESVLIRANRQYANKLVVIDAVYSMDGDIANLPEISALCKKYNALLMVDEAHSVGVIGKNGLGILDHYGMPSDSVDILMGTLSKAVGATGGYITGKKELINYCKVGSRSYMFSTAPCIASNAAALEAIRQIKQDASHIHKLHKNIDYFKAKLIEKKYNIGNTESCIFPIIFADHNKVLDVTRTMANNGVIVNGVPYPIVPRKRTRLRMTITANMTEDQLDKGFNELNNAVNAYENGEQTSPIVEENNEASMAYQQKISSERQSLLSGNKIVVPKE